MCFFVVSFFVTRSFHFFPSFFFLVIMGRFIKLFLFISVLLLVCAATQAQEPKDQKNSKADGSVPSELREVFTTVKKEKKKSRALPVVIRVKNSIRPDVIHSFILDLIAECQS